MRFPIKVAKLYLIFQFTGSVFFIQGAGISPAMTDTDLRNDYDVKFYLLDLHVSDSSTFIRGSTSIVIDPKVQQLSQVLFDFSNALHTDSVLLSGQKINFVHIQNALNIELPSPIAPGDIRTISIYYHGLGKNTGTYSGIYSKFNSSWNKRITWTLSEPFSAMNWFPCKQDLKDKADSAYIFLSTNSSLKAGSNGLLTAQVTLPDNRVRYEWKSRFPIAFYLISFAVSDYRDYSFYVKKKTDQDSILVQNYIYNEDGYLDQNKSAIDKTADMILLYADLFGNYPFESEKYGHCVAPLGGGMEHQTMTTLVNFSFLLVAHELAHQWFGNYVTCSTWQDIWINEGFASYAEYLSNQYLRSQEMADAWITGVHDYIKSIPGGSVYVPEELVNDEERIFDYRLTYNKGAAILHMIRQEVGHDSLFFKALSTFLHKYKNSNATGLDFRDHLNEITGKDFSVFFEQWYFGEGFPIHTISWNQHGDTLLINSLQTVSSTTPFFNVPLEFKITVNNQDTLITLRQTNSFNNWRIYLPGVVSSVVVDPFHWLILEVTDIQNAVKTERESKFRVVPNPAKEKVNVYYTNEGNSYTLYMADASGKVLFSQQSLSQHNSIDIGQYPAGLYFIIIEDRHAIHQEKFIIY